MQADFVHYTSRSCITKMKKDITIFLFILCLIFFSCCAGLVYFPVQWKQVLSSTIILSATIRLQIKFAYFWCFTMKQISISKHILFCLVGFTSGRASSCFEFTNKLLIQVGSFFSFLQVSLYFSKLGQIQSSNFFCLFYLLLVCLDL